MEKKYGVDRTAFEGLTFEEADNHYGYWKTKTMKERLEAYWYLTCKLFGVNAKTQIDFSVRDCRKHKNG